MTQPAVKDHTTQHGDHEHGHNPYLAHHFDTEEQQFDSNKFGMWLFLATEILLFSGLFCAYAVYRSNHPEIFLYAHQYLDKFWGGVNTVILIFSSFTMAWAVRCAQLNQKKLLIANLIVTLICAAGFLGVKFIEYKHKWHEGLLWGVNYDPQDHGAHGADHGDDSHSDDGSHGAAAEHDNHSETAQDHSSDIAPEPDVIQTEANGFQIERSKIPDAPDGPAGLAKVETTGHGTDSSPSNVHIFFGIYFAMTGLHGLHVIAGMAAIGWILYRAIKGEFNSQYFIPVDLVGLYWHVVDLVWIYLFPLLYLIH